jgi:undecaprenyl diphosphate synthase
VSRDVPQLAEPRVPRHVAVIMDGNGRWARQRGRARSFGHLAGRRAVRRIVRAAHLQGVEVLTLFAFSQENWNRPETEVRLLMELFIRTLGREVANLHRQNVRLSFIGDHRDFPPRLRSLMADAAQHTAANTGLRLVIAVGYGGQWDIAQAAQRLCATGAAITPEAIEAMLSTSDLPHPDLLIRTGGERRISNFMLWQLAYAEFYFTDILWPDFAEGHFADALAWFAGRERRFGRVPEAG